MGTSRGMDRLVFFTDAVTAIAITLLILPLVELVPGAQAKGSPEDFFADNFDEIISFLISFVVIARLWVAHHRVFDHVASYTARLIALSLFWTLTIVVLPLPTVMTAEYEPTRTVLGFYIGTMMLSSLTLTTIAFSVRQNPNIESTDNPITTRFVWGSATISGAFVLAFVLALLLPQLSYWVLLVLFISAPIDAIVRRKTSAGPGPGPLPGAGRAR